MTQLLALARAAAKLDGRNYGAYKQLRGQWGEGPASLCIDHVQGDPFASPSRVRWVLDPSWHEIPAELRDTEVRRTAIADFILRRFARAAAGATSRSGSGKSGQVRVDAGGAEILARSGAAFCDDDLELRFAVGLPARGRRVLGHQAARLLTEELWGAAQRVRWSALSERAQADAREHVALAEEHAHLQAMLAPRGLVAFVRDGSVLPRASGISSAPLADAVTWQSPPSLRVTLPSLYHGDVVGTGIPCGITLVTGGGFHGKTTLLEAICHGIAPHVAGDGREWVVTSPDAVKVRSEDGRGVEAVDLSPLIVDLPGRRDTTRFCTPDASGSTSLAAAIVESLEAGASALLLDEDTCATNLLIRDARMQALVEQETITPLIDRVQDLHHDLGVSTILVVGGSGDYLEVADTVVLMEHYRPHEVTERAKAIAAQHPTGRAVTDRASLRRPQPRVAEARSFDPPDPRRRGRPARVRARGLRELVFGEDTIDLSALEQLVDDSQARAIGVLLRWLGTNGDPELPIAQRAEQALAAARTKGLYAIDPLPDLVMVRRYELIAAINRLRSLRVR